MPKFELRAPWSLADRTHVFPSILFPPTHQYERAQSHPTLRDLKDWSLTGASGHGILQARIPSSRPPTGDVLNYALRKPHAPPFLVSPLISACPLCPSGTFASSFRSQWQMQILRQGWKKSTMDHRVPVMLRLQHHPQQRRCLTA